MSLILAIEPNKNQAHQLSALVRAHLKAELVTAPTAAAALAALGDRIPDVVLTPALFGLRDEAALTERLRQLGSDGSHVQTLAIPILAAPSKGGPNAGGLLNRKKEKGDAEVGCDPAVFAEQIRIYLQRAAVERRAQASEAAARAMAATPATASAEAAPDEDMSFMVSADELDVDSLELATIPPPAAPAPAVKAAAPVREKSPEPVFDEQAHRAKARTPRPPGPGEAEAGLVTPPAAGPPLWKVSESEDLYDAAATAAAISTPDMMVEPMAPPPKPVVQSAAPPAPRRRRTPPQPDEWTYFDPSQGVFQALVRRLDEIAGAAA
jgi:CheY-like chemotaxis protein